MICFFMTGWMMRLLKKKNHQKSCMKRKSTDNQTSKAETTLELHSLSYEDV